MLSGLHFGGTFSRAPSWQNDSWMAENHELRCLEAPMRALNTVPSDWVAAPNRIIHKLRKNNPVSSTGRSALNTVAIYCPVCGDRREASQVFVRDGFPIVRCSGCGVGKTQLPQGFSTDQIYNEDYFQGGQADGYSDYIGSEDVLRAEFRTVVEDLRRRGCGGGKLLELGCAYGFFLAEAQPYLEVHGIEVSESAVRFCRSLGLDVEQGSLTEEYVKARGPFDAVVMLDVVEHLTEPDQVMHLLWRAMKPGGKLLLSTGDWESVLSRTMGRYWRLMTPPQHTFFFSPRTMSAMLSRVGFDVVECRKPWKIVPVGLVGYQLGRILGMSKPPRLRGVRFGLPVNLFDAFRMVAVRREGEAWPKSRKSRSLDLKDICGTLHG
jgi:SAM-dependent methyltransferase